MITPLLEKAIFNGKAVYKKYTHAFGMFGSITIPKDKIIVITDIKWNQFINPYKNDGMVSMKDFLNYNEYQMRIDGNRSNNFLTYRNQITINAVDYTIPFSIDETVNDFSSSTHFVVGPPIQQDVFFICEKFINITISRNAYRDAFVSTYGLMSQRAVQPDAPNGVQDINVLLDLEMNSLNDPTSQYYSPPQYVNTGVTSNPRSRESYSQSVWPFDSEIFPPDTGFNATLARPYLTSPLVEFGCVIINSNEFNNLMQS